MAQRSSLGNNDVPPVVPGRSRSPSYIRSISASQLPTIMSSQNNNNNNNKPPPVPRNSLIRSKSAQLYQQQQVTQQQFIQMNVSNEFSLIIHSRLVKSWRRYLIPQFKWKTTTTTHSTILLEQLETITTTTTWKMYLNQFRLNPFCCPKVFRSSRPMASDAKFPSRPSSPPALKNPANITTLYTIGF